jgi:hypothetical protein
MEVLLADGGFDDYVVFKAIVYNIFIDRMSICSRDDIIMQKEKGTVLFRQFKVTTSRQTHLSTYTNNSSPLNASYLMKYARNKEVGTVRKYD